MPADSMAGQAPGRTAAMGDVDAPTGLHSLLPATVVEWLLTDPARTGRNVDGTVMSADISGFTRLTESLLQHGTRDAAETLIRTVNRCLTPMIERVATEGGDTLKLGGDAVFALFPDVGSAERAARCAAAIVADLDELNAELDNPLSMTVGLATGVIPLLLTGSDRRELVLRGPVVDECLRLETEAEPGEVLVCSQTAGLLPDEWSEVVDDGLRALVLNVVGADPPVSAPAVEGVAPRPGPPADVDDAIGAAIGPELSSAFEAFVDTVGEIRLVTVAFIDLPATELDDAELLATVQRLMDLCAEHEVAMLGSDVSSGGLKFMLAAGAPTAGDDDEDAMLRVLTAFVHDPDAPAMSAGVNRGHTYAGFLGSSRFRTFTTMGDPTNLAARLMGRAEGRSVVVSETVLEHCTAAWSTTELSPILVRGRHQPVVVHRLEGQRRGGRRPLGRQPRPRLRGRQDELRAAADAVADARRGRGTVVEFRGRRGRGLTRLLDEIDERRPDGFVRFRIDGRTTSNSVPYGDVGPIIGSIVGVDDNPDDRFRLEELTAWVERTAPRSRDLVPLLAPMIGATAEPTSASAAIEPEFRLSTAAEVIASILGTSLTTPTLFLVDNLHRLDAASLSVIKALAAEADGRPWIVLAGGRPGTEPLVPGREPIILPPLTDDETVGLVAEIAPDLPDGRRNIIASRSAGNPFFAVALAIAEADGSAADGPDDRAENNRTASAVVDSIEQLVTAQIDRLGHHARVVLRTAAVLGHSFDTATLARLLDVHPGELDLDKHDSVGGLLDRIDESTYRFRAAVVQEVAYAGLSRHRAAELHGAVAALLEKAGAAPADLAWHHSRAGNLRAALEHGREAAEDAAALGLMVDATDHLLLTVDAIDRAEWPAGEADALLAEVLERLYEIGVSAGRHADAVTAGQRALGLITEPMTRVRLLTGVASNRAEAQGTYDAEIDLLTTELAALDTDLESGAARAWLGETLAVLTYRRGDIDGALALSELACDEAHRSGELRPLTSALLIRHMILGDRNVPEQHEVWRELLAAATELDDPKLLTFAHNNRGLDLQGAGDWDTAVELYEAAAAHAERSGDRYRRLFPAINRAVLRGDQGHRDEARLELDRLRRDAAHDASGFTAAWANRELGRLEAFSGNRDQARSHLESARAWYVEAGNVVAIHEVDLTLAAADLGVGRSHEVLAAVPEIPVPDEPSPRVAGWTETIIGFALLQQDRPTEALASFERAVTATTGRYRFGVALALVGRSEAERFAGRGRSARKTRAEADAILSELGVTALPVVPLPR